MKCPECGFECLPDDVECLACGVDIAAAVKNQEKERIRSIEAAERKEKYEMEYKKELGLISDNDEKEIPSEEKIQKKSLPEKPTCPKCGAERKPESKECIRCGVIYDKVDTKSSIDGDPGEPKPEDKTKEIDLNDLEIVDEQQTETAHESVSEKPVVEKPHEPPSAPMESSAESAESGDVSVPPPAQKDAPEPAEPHNEIPSKIFKDNPDEASESDKTEIISLKHSDPSSKLGKVRYNLSQTYEKIKPRLAISRTQCGVILKDKRTSWVAAAIGLIVIISIASTFGVSYYKNAKIQRLQREHEEKLEKIRVDFMTNKVEIDQKIRTLVSNKLFDNAEKEIALYDIPALQNELKPLKNYLKEIKLFEKAKTIPGKEYENNYKAYLELMGVNPDNEMYSKKMEIYKERFANSKYLQAKAYSVSKNKNVTELSKAMVAIDKALDLYPESKTFAKLKYTLLIENLLYYEGNENIVMAVRDDGMGKKLFSNQRKLTIWIKNTSPEPLYINVQFFSMIGKDKKRYTYNDMGKKFKTKLEPGEQSKGELYFRTRTSPSKVIFSHLISGEISRTFP